MCILRDWEKQEIRCKTDEDCKDENRFCLTVRKGVNVCAIKTCKEIGDCKTFSHCMLAGEISPQRCFLGKGHFKGRGNRKGQCIYNTEIIAMC